MSWSSPGQRRIVYLLVAFCALAVRFGYWSQIRGTPLDEWHKWDQSDMATYVEQARRLAAGDWLAREPYHPYHAWQRGVASEDEWLRWYGPLSFHQSPLYSYGLAALSKLRNDPLPLAKALQLVLGAVTCVLVAHLAGRIGGIAVALVAGLLAALYGPLYYLEPQVLRDGPAVFGFLALSLLMMRHADLPQEAPIRRLARSAGVLGLCIGAYALFHESSAVLAVGAAIVVGVHAARSGARRPAIALAALAAGYVLGFAPLLARNAAVGAPLWTGSSRLAVNVTFANMASAPDGGALFQPPGPEFAQIMNASGGTTWGVAREVWRGYESQRGQLFRNWAHRLRVTWVVAELPDNTSFRFYRRHSSVLRASLSFPWIFPAAGAVWIAWLAERRWLRRAEPVGTGGAREPFRLGPWFADRASTHAILVLFALLLTLAMSLNMPQARYRLSLVPMFIVYTSLALVGGVRLLASQRFALFGVLASATAVLAVFHIWVSEPRAYADDRFVDYSVASSLYRKRGNEDAAAEYARRRVIGPWSDRPRESPDEP